jgi:hypothetical protein
MVCPPVLVVDSSAVFNRNRVIVIVLFKVPLTLGRLFPGGALSGILGVSTQALLCLDDLILLVDI